MNVNCFSTRALTCRTTFCLKSVRQMSLACLRHYGLSIRLVAIPLVDYQNGSYPQRIILHPNRNFQCRSEILRSHKIPEKEQFNIDSINCTYKLLLVSYFFTESLSRNSTVLSTLLSAFIQSICNKGETCNESRHNS